MKLTEISAIYELIAKGSQGILQRQQSIQLRKNAMFGGMIKVAFDTRRIDQELEFNPRRGLQNYNRSEQFITESMSNKIIGFRKIKEVLDDIKSDFEKNAHWQDSYARVLCGTVDQVLRVNQKDGDYSDHQPSMGSFNYLDELLQLRYRINHDDINKFSNKQLRKIILDKDEDLINRENKVEIKKSDIKESYDTLLEKLFGGVKATEENPSVERTITITIKDSIKDV